MFEKTGAFFAVIVLSLAFAFVSFLVIVSNRNRKLISWKLRLGALLITFTAVNANCQQPMVTCYEPMRPEPVIIDAKFYSDYQITVNFSEGRIITGKIRGGYGDKFLYTITWGELNKEIQSGVLSKSDGTFNPATSGFIIKLGRLMEPYDKYNKYNLHIYTGNPGRSSDSRELLASFILNIK